MSNSQVYCTSNLFNAAFYKGLPELREGLRVGVQVCDVPTTAQLDAPKPAQLGVPKPADWITAFSKLGTFPTLGTLNKEGNHAYYI